MQQENQIVKVFENKNVRIHVIDNVPYFSGKDVCEILKITAYRDMMTNLDEDEKMFVSILVDTKENRKVKRKMTFINESGVYECVFRSKHPEAKKFKKWVKSEVLPSIREKGKYELPIQIKNDKYVNAMIQKIESETKMIQIETQNKAMKIFEEKGDDRSVIVCVDNIKNIIRSSTTNQLMIEDKSRLNTLSERIYNHMNLKPSKELTNKINSLGGRIAPMYRKKYNSEPKHNIQECKGHETRVKCYSIQDYEDWIDNEIKKFLNL